MSLYYEVIASGSSGNSVLIGDVLIDCGVPFSKIKEHLYDVKYLLLTHIHSDHIRPSTLDKIKSLFPKIKIIGNHEVHQMYGVHIIANADYPIETEHYTFLPFLCPHDVLTYGFVWKSGNDSIIYATDTTTMENAPDEKFDYIFIESNHSEKKVEAILKNPKKFGYNAYASAKRHLSTELARNFYYLHRKDRNSHFVELHKSSRFY